MVELSSWSDAKSAVTMEGGGGEVGVCKGGCTDAFASPRRCVLPKVQPALNVRDQQVPVYWDQTVPVWPSCTQPEGRASKGALAPTSSGIGHGEGRSSTYLRSSLGEDSSSEGTETEYDGGYGSRRNAIDHVSDVEVSFDDIMSIYHSSVLKRTSRKWSRALRAILNHRSRKRLACKPPQWRRFAKNSDSTSTVGNISVQLKCSRLGERHVSTDVEASLLRSLQEAIERTSICDSTSTNSRYSSGMHLLPSDDAIIQVQRCQVQRRCDNHFESAYHRLLVKLHLWNFDKA